MAAGDQFLPAAQHGDHRDHSDHCAGQLGETGLPRLCYSSAISSVNHFLGSFSLSSTIIAVQHLWHYVFSGNACAGRCWNILLEAPPHQFLASVCSGLYTMYIFYCIHILVKVLYVRGWWQEQARKRGLKVMIVFADNWYVLHMIQYAWYNVTLPFNTAICGGCQHRLLIREHVSTPHICYMTK